MHLPSTFRDLLQAFDRCQTAPGQLSLSRFQHRTKPNEDSDTINDREVKLNLKTRPSPGIYIIDRVNS